nr:MAG TPA: hypothetical protein [Caudoviricetes sp.]
MGRIFFSYFCGRIQWRESLKNRNLCRKTLS